jgi:hypothetical protein
MAIPIHTLGTFQPEYGEAGGGVSGQDNWLAADSDLFGNKFRLYGISGPLIAPAADTRAVPEPGSVLLLGTGILAVGRKRLRTRARRPHTIPGS